MPETPSTIQHDIAELERLLEAKKAELEHEKPEKDILHGILGEKIQQHAPTYTPALPSSSSPQAVEPPSYLSQELKDKVQATVRTVFDKNLDEGIKEAVRSNNMALIDAFHDILVDELCDQLIEKRKLDKVE